MFNVIYNYLIMYDIQYNYIYYIVLKMYEKINTLSLSFIISIVIQNFCSNTNRICCKFVFTQSIIILNL